MTLSKQDILNKNKKIIYVNALDGELIFRKIPARVAVLERGNKSDLELSFNVIAASIIDENNEPMYTVEEVENLPLEVFNEISKIVSEINNLKVEESSSLKNAQTEGSI